jgi:multimeric flavodoxin WrbA
MHGILHGLPVGVFGRFNPSEEVIVNVLVISSSPNTDGLTAACAAAATQGVALAGGHAQEIRLNDLEVGLCHACGNGWGTCRTDHTCQIKDDFQALHRRVCEADAYVLVSPVYYGELSESAKALTDRLRRCEATRGDSSGFVGKPVIAVAAAGGGGGGTVTCLMSIERWIQHVRGRVFDLIPVTRATRPHKLAIIQEAAQAMASSDA